MILEHLGRTPEIDADAYVAPTATVCGDVTLGPGCRVLHGACLVAEGGAISLGRNVIVLETAVLRSTGRHDLTIGDDCLVGPHAHLVGCTIEDRVFVATGASVFHAARLETRSEVRVNGVVHVSSRVLAGATVPIGWVAVGDPAEILPPEQHDRIWAIQRKLDFPGTVYGVERPGPEGSEMPEVARRLAEIYRAHRDDRIVE